MPKSRVHCSMGFQFLVMSNLGSLFMIICSRWSLKTQVIMSLWQIYTNDLIMEELWRFCTTYCWDLIKRIGRPLIIPWTCLEYLLTHGLESVANEFQSEKDVKEKIWKTIMWSLIASKLLMNLGKLEEREVVWDICETNNQIRIQGVDGSEEYFQSSSISNIFGTE